MFIVTKEKNVIGREDFIFTIGYDGDSAVVDSNAKKKYGKMTTDQLIDAGLFKPALCSAVYAGKDEEIEAVKAAYSRVTGAQISGPDHLKLILGVQSIPDSISKTTLI